MLRFLITLVALITLTAAAVPQTLTAADDVNAGLFAPVRLDHDPRTPAFMQSLGLELEAAAAQQCCKICTKGKACGDTCIDRDKTCHQPPGCACDG
jgi:hypothetical protein